MLQEIHILVRLAVSLLLAGALGWERSAAGKSAGLRTHMLVGFGSTLFVVLGELFVVRYSELHPNMQFDPIRIIEAVVTGISFLGAGTIFVSRADDRVQGLTTAAAIWATAAVGITVGLERYVLAVGSTLVVLVVLRVLNAFERAVLPDQNHDR